MQCRRCWRVFPSHHALADHSAVCRLFHQCSFCFHGFSDAGDLYSHFVEHHLLLAFVLAQVFLPPQPDDDEDDGEDDEHDGGDDEDVGEDGEDDGEDAEEDGEDAEEDGEDAEEDGEDDGEDAEAGYYSNDPSPQVSNELAPLIGDKEPLSVLASQLQGTMQEKAVLLTEKYAALRRSRGDQNRSFCCSFFRSFMFSYLEHILVTRDVAEVERVLIRIEQGKENLYTLGYAGATYEACCTSFTDLLGRCASGTEASLSLDELLEKARDQTISKNGVMFLTCITSAEIQTRADFFARLISDESSESEQAEVMALSDALGVPIRVVYLDSKPLTTRDRANENYHDFCPSAANESIDQSNQEKPVPFVTLLYRPGHYDILYPIQ